MTFLKLFRDFFTNVYLYREYLKQSVARDLRKKYKRSVLGYLWSMLNPLFMMIILAVVFSNIMHRVDNYAVFLFSGMLAWGYFDGTVQMCLGTIRANSRIIDQLPVPKFIFPLSVALYNIVTFLLSLVPMVLVMLYTGHPISWSLLYLPVVLIPLFFITMGTGLLFAVSNVFFEDTQHLVGVIFKALYFLCPILYARDHLPSWLVHWVVLNPMFGIIESMRAIFYDGIAPNWETYGWNLGGSLLILAFGLWVFRKADDKFIYFI